FPVFAKAREKARQTSCLSNLKQLGLALMQYAQDYDEKIVKCYLWYPDPNLTHIRWYWQSTSNEGMLYPYIKNSQVFLCPTEGCYGLSVAIGQTGSGTGTAMASIQSPSETVAFADVLLWHGDIDTGRGGTAARGLRLFKYSDRYNAGRLDSGCYGGGLVAPRHNDGTNFAFCDGHAKWLKPMATETPVNMWDLN
ncbi:MAG: DUF1559 domain-containing protein, partial [Armatimonadetes bacterium]|nr:DUF1559 domain-containing protein [Armatimonadota bacterium]